MVITVINAKGGCGKTTISLGLAGALAERGKRVLVIDLDPQADATETLGVGYGESIEESVTSAFAGHTRLAELIRKTPHDNMSAIGASEQLELLGYDLKESDPEGYHTILKNLLDEVRNMFDFVVVDSPNQVSPVMENAVYATDLFIVPFEGAGSLKRYANLDDLIRRIRPEEDYKILHVLSNLSRTSGWKKELKSLLSEFNIQMAKTELRSCAYVSRVSIYGGSICHYRPRSNGAMDIRKFAIEVQEVLGLDEEIQATRKKLGKFINVTNDNHE